MATDYQWISRGDATRCWCVQSFDYFETENEEFLRQQSQADPRVCVSKLIPAGRQYDVSYH